MQKKYIVLLCFMLVGVFFLFVHFDRDGNENLTKIDVYIKGYSCHEGRNQNYTHEIIIEDDIRYYNLNYYTCKNETFDSLIEKHSKVNLIVDSREFYQVKVNSNIIMSYEKINEALKNRMNGSLMGAILFLGLASILLYRIKAPKI